MTMGRKVAELNTLSDGKGITGIRFFNEMEDTNESTNLRKLADAGCQRIVAVRDIATEALSGSLESLLTSEDPVKKKKKSIHIVSGAKFAAKYPFSPNSTVTKPSKPSSKSESSVHCCRAAVKTRRNSKEWSPKLDQNETILPDFTFENHRHAQKLFVIIVASGLKCRRHRFMCTWLNMEDGDGDLRWRSSLKPF